MANKNDLVRLKDKDNVYVCPVTRADGVFMEDGVTTVSSQLEHIATREYISLDTFGDTQIDYQKVFDYCNENGLGILIPNKTFYINEPIVLKEQGTYYIKGCNTNMNDGSRIKSKSVLKPKTILFKGELTNNNTVVYMTLENVRIMPETSNGYAKVGTYVFYNLNLFGLVLDNVTCRHIDVFSQGYISKASVIRNTRVSFIKTAFLKGNEFNGAFIADSQITDSYITGAYPVTLFQGIGVNTTVSGCFIDYFKYIQDSLGQQNNQFVFKNNTIGIFYRWFRDNTCRGHVEIIGNKIDNVSNNALITASATNFVEIDDDMRNGIAGAFVQSVWFENINNVSTDKCKVHGNRFTESDNVFTKSNGYMQVSIKDNSYSNIKGLVYDLSFRDTTNGVDKFGEFYCDGLDNKIVTTLPLVRSGNNVYCFEGQKCILDNVEYTLINDKWVATSNLNYYTTNEIIVGKYLGKDLYRKVVTGTLELLSTGFKQLSFPEAENIFIDFNHSYFGESKMTFNSYNKVAVTDICVALSTFNSNKILMYSINQSNSYTCTYSIVVEYTKI